MLIVVVHSTAEDLGGILTIMNAPPFSHQSPESETLSTRHMS